MSLISLLRFRNLHYCFPLRQAEEISPASWEWIASLSPALPVSSRDEPYEGDVQDSEDCGPSLEPRKLEGTPSGWLDLMTQGWRSDAGGLLERNAATSDRQPVRIGLSVPTTQHQFLLQVALSEGLPIARRPLITQCPHQHTDYAMCNRYPAAPRLFC